MREYIVNLTNNIIAINHFDDAFARVNGEKCAFVKYAKNALAVGSVANMSPETLGRIMGSFEIGDIVLSPKELFSEIRSVADLEFVLRELVSTGLAYAIYGRLESGGTMANAGIPAYYHNKEKGAR